MSKPTPVYTVKNVKSFMGMDCPGYNCTLYRDGKKVADVVDDGSGGETDIKWTDAYVKVNGEVRCGERVEIHTVDYKGEPHTYKGTPEEKLLVESLAGKTLDFEDSKLTMDAALFIGELVDAHKTDAKFRRECKSKTLVRLEGDAADVYHIYKLPYNITNKTRILAHLEKEGKKVVEFINDRYTAKVVFPVTK